MNTKRNKQNTGFSPRLFMIIGILAFPLAICASLVQSFNSYGNIPSEFCTLDDEVYQEIATNTDKWSKYFYDNPSILTLPFSVSTGRKYIVNATQWYPRDPNPQFYVQIKETVNEPFGLAGYFYNTADVLDDRYNVQVLSGNIFCYRLE